MSGISYERVDRLWISTLQMLLIITNFINQIYVINYLLVAFCFDKY
jgi:hypothetical protein